MTGSGTSDGVYVGALDGAEPKPLLRGNANAIYALPGYLLFVQQGTLMAQRFDTEKLQLIGDASALAEQVSSNIGVRAENVAASDTGLLVYARGSSVPGGQLLWFDRSGKQIGDLAPALIPVCGFRPMENRLQYPSGPQAIPDPASGCTTCCGQESRLD